MSRRILITATIIALALGGAFAALAQKGPASRPAVGPASAPSSQPATKKVSPHAHAPGDTFFTCPMHPEVHEHAAGRCPICKMNLVERAVQGKRGSATAPAPKAKRRGARPDVGKPPAPPPPAASPRATPPVAAPAAAQPGDDEVEYWTCSMHPHVKEAEPGSCPVCSMDLTPVTKGDLRTGIVTVDAVRRQMIGVRTASVERRPMTQKIRALGRVELDESRIVDVTMQSPGWVEGLRVKETGQLVERGQTLLSLYSPQVVAASEELLLAAEAAEGAASDAGKARSKAMLSAARGKLRSLGLAAWQVDSLLTERSAPRRVGVVAPAGGYIVAKEVVEGAHVRTGARIFRIVPLDRVWVDAAVYAKDLPAVRVGQPATARPRHAPEMAGEIEWVYPAVDPATQTGKVRIAADNPDLRLRPGMFVDVEIDVELGERLVVPASAVVFTGRTRLVFVNLGEGRLLPTLVKLGVKTSSGYEVLEGLQAGDTVVTSGAFLIAAESRIRSAAAYWGATDVTD